MLGVLFGINLITGVQLFFAQDLIFAEELDRLGRDKGLKRLDGVADIGQAAFFRLTGPLVGVVVAVKDNPTVFGHYFLDDQLDLLVDVFGLLQSGGDLVQGFGGNGV